MFTDALILTVAVITNLILVLLSFRRNPGSATNRLFAAVGITLCFWSIVNFFSFQSDNKLVATWLVRLVMVLSTPLGIFFFLFVHTFPRASLAMSKKAFWAWMVVMVLTMTIAASPLLFPEITIVSGQPPKPTPGIGLILYVPVVILTTIYGIILMIRKFIRAKGLERIQTGYLMAGAGIMFPLIIGFNFVVVNVFNTTAFVPYGALFTLPFVALTAYAIVRYRLMDIRAAIARSLSFSFLVGSFFLIYSAIFIFAVPPLAARLGVREGIVAAAGALLAVLLARYVQEVLKRLTDRFLFQNQADYRRALVDASKELSGTINIDDVTKTVLAVMKNVVRAKKTVIFLQESGSNSFSPRANFGAGRLNVSIPKNHLLVRHLSHTMGPLVKDELSREREGERLAQHAAEIAQVEQAFNWLDIAVVLPLYVNKQLTGLIALG